MTAERVFALIGAGGVAFCLSAAFLPVARAFVRWRMDRRARRRAIADVTRVTVPVAGGGKRR